MLFKSLLLKSKYKLLVNYFNKEGLKLYFIKADKMQTKFFSHILSEKS